MSGQPDVGVKGKKELARQRDQHVQRPWCWKQPGVPVKIILETFV